MTNEEIQQAIDDAMAIANNAQDGVALRLEAARLQMLVNMHERTDQQSTVSGDSGSFDGEWYLEVRQDVINALENKIHTGFELVPPWGKTTEVRSYLINQSQAEDLFKMVIDVLANGGVFLNVH